MSGAHSFTHTVSWVLRQRKPVRSFGLTPCKPWSPFHQVMSPSWVCAGSFERPHSVRCRRGRGCLQLHKHKKNSLCYWCTSNNRCGSLSISNLLIWWSTMNKRLKYHMRKFRQKTLKIPHTEIQTSWCWPQDCQEQSHATTFQWSPRTSWYLRF